METCLPDILNGELDHSETQKNLIQIMAKDKDNIFFTDEQQNKFMILHSFDEIDYKIQDFKCNLYFIFF